MCTIRCSKMRRICHYNCQSETESRCVTAFIARQIFSDGIFSHLNRNRREKNCAKLHTEITIVIQSLNGIQWIERNKHGSARAYSALAAPATPAITISTIRWYGLQCWHILNEWYRAAASGISDDVDGTRDESRKLFSQANVSYFDVCALI